jgi:hypothetical protein
VLQHQTRSDSDKIKLVSGVSSLPPLSLSLSLSLSLILSQFIRDIRRSVRGTPLRCDAYETRRSMPSMVAKGARPRPGRDSSQLHPTCQSRGSVIGRSLVRASDRPSNSQTHTLSLSLSLMRAHSRGSGIRNVVHFGESCARNRRACRTRRSATAAVTRPETVKETRFSPLVYICRRSPCGSTTAPRRVFLTVPSPERVECTLASRSGARGESSRFRDSVFPLEIWGRERERERETESEGDRLGYLVLSYLL